MGTDPSPLQAMVADLAKVGVQAQLQGVDTATWITQYRGGPDARGQMWYGTTSWDQTFDAAITYRWWSSDFTVENGRRWVDDKFDQLYQKANATVDTTQRANAWHDA